MKTLVLFYSFSGKTRALAVKKSTELGADIEEITELNKSSKIKAYTSGAVSAMKRKKVSIKPLKLSPDDYEKIVIMTPIWAGKPAPAFNSVIGLIPPAKQVELIFVSSSGKSADIEGTKKLIRARGCDVAGYTDIKA